MMWLKKWAVSLMLLTVLFLSCYILGQSHCEIKTLTQEKKEIIREVEVVKYVEKEKAKIWAKSNAAYDELINLMQANKL